jgi:hypothetical protein
MASNDPPPTEANARYDSLVQHGVHRQPSDIQAPRDFFDGDAVRRTSEIAIAELFGHGRN